jgi:(E)-4-hydroxy-3-methylbut-2-enyl-diphosphate synthase
MYGNTPRGMVESAMEFVRICYENDFHNLVLSMKASNVKEMTAANLLLVEEMINEGFYYPVHLGVTEAGNGEEARIKSAAGIGSLLALGIGDTVRVSLAENPVEEVPVAKKIIKQYGRKPEAVEEILKTTLIIKPQSEETTDKLSGIKYPVLTRKITTLSDIYFSEDGNNMLLKNSRHKLTWNVLKYTDSKNSLSENIILKKVYSELKTEDLLLKASADFAILFMLKMQAGIWLENENGKEQDRLAEISLKILQGLGLRYSNAEFVACPSCGRTKFNLFESFNIVKEKTSLRMVRQSSRMLMRKML